MKWFLYDDILNQSVFRQAHDWREAERIARNENLTLIGQYRKTAPEPFWLSQGHNQTIH